MSFGKNVSFLVLIVILIGPAGRSFGQIAPEPRRRRRPPQIIIPQVVIERPGRVRMTEVNGVSKV